ncbi:helix-turn-helix domain-containing protein [Paludicola sp. MB14-C6]|uniref:ROK family transcriptional regulator n=1 Tax=Paludihabitans sp. MB14-C6 TaxID=3070656 RepID=UPI0027DC4540|nr:helix-turn-helix domain-containing protein [Paludicola sp. MB14-C6]WMJ21830.1 helix-turn-helix domain-containing protein [Paludicola sp. MB14-C6]
MELDFKFSIKKRNRIEILNLLLNKGPLSRVDIANSIKLTKAAVTIITNEMIQCGLLYEKSGQPQQNRLTRGRRKILLDINEYYRLVFGIVFEKDSMIIGLTNLKGETLDKKKIQINGKVYREVLELIVTEIQRLMKSNCITSEKILGIGVCMQNLSCSFMEQGTVEEKLIRMKKDLSYAISIKIVTQTTVNACLIAQHLFQQETKNKENILMIRYGDTIDAGVMIRNQVYITQSKRCGGFQVMQYRGESDTYNEYQISLQQHPENEEQIKKELQQHLAKDIHICQLVLDANAIYAYGNYFEETQENIAQINTILSCVFHQKTPVQLSCITTPTIYLAGCAIAINECFYKEGAC